MATDPRDIASSFQSFDAKFVTFKVGPDRVERATHLSRLTQTSRTFRDVLERKQAEGKPLAFTLQDEEPAVFDIYLCFIYSGKIAIKRSEEHMANGVGVDVGEYPLLAKLYCFGEKCHDIRFKNTVIDAIIANTNEEDAEGTRWCPTDGAVDIIYKGTRPESPARKLVVDLHVKIGNEGWLEGGLNNHEFLIDLAKGFYKHKRRIAILEEVEEAQYDNPNAKYHEPEE